VSRYAPGQCPPGAQTVDLTFDALRESRTIADKLTRVQIALPMAQGRRLWEPPDSQPDREQPAASVKGDGHSDARRDVVDVATENEQARQRRNRRRQPFRLGWLKVDLVDVHGRVPPARPHRARRGKPSERTPPPPSKNGPVVRVNQGTRTDCDGLPSALVARAGRVRQ